MKIKNFFKKNIILNCICLALTLSFFLSSVNFTAVGASSLSSYDLRAEDAVTSVKNQGNANTCWAFAAVGAIESSLIKGGYADSSIDLSEAHLGWFSINTEISNENDLTYGDGYTVSNTFQYGGNDLYVIWSIARGFGLEFEEFVKYDIEHINSLNVRENERYVSEFKVTEVNIFNNSEFESIKDSIAQNGALMASYYDSPNCYTESKDGYSFYDGSNATTNHATLIVGWDDNYSKENFGIARPESDGAWLCRNTRGKDWGDDGYFWLSYETASLKRIVSFKAEPSEEDIYQIYQYDGYGFSKALSIDDSGVVYTSNIFDSTEHGILEKVAFYTTMHNLDHEISVYQLKNGYDSPIDGVLLSRFNKYAPYSGYYLVDLPTPIEISEGVSFSVVIKISGEGRIKFYAEGVNDRTSVEGKSFASQDGKEWLDTASYGFGNLCIKAWINPTVYEGPDTEYLVQTMSPLTNEYYEDNVLSSLIDKAESLLSNGGTQREILNNYLRLACLYEKYFGYVTIDNEEQFLIFSELVNSGKDFTDTVVVLQSDLDFNGLEYVVPSGFNGIFNGKFHNISGINHTGSYSSGIFGNLHTGSIIKNIIVKNCSFISEVYAGGISSWNEGIISDCSVEAYVFSSKDFSGAIAGYNEGIIQFCAFRNSSETSKKTKLVYENYGSISDCLFGGASISFEGNKPSNCFGAYLENNILVINGTKVKNQNAESFARLFCEINSFSAGNTYTGANVGSDIKVILIGDVDSDGTLSSSDYLRIKSYFLQMIDLNEYQLKAADTNRDGTIGATDYLLIKSHFLTLINMYGEK